MCSFILNFFMLFLVQVGLRVLFAFTPNLPTNIVDFKGFDSSIILIQRGGILMSIGKLPESLSQAMLAGIILVGGLCVFGVSLSFLVFSLVVQVGLRVFCLSLFNIYIYIHIHTCIYIYICICIYIYIYTNI